MYLNIFLSSIGVFLNLPPRPIWAAKMSMSWGFGQNGKNLGSSSKLHRLFNWFRMPVLWKRRPFMVTNAIFRPNQPRLKWRSLIDLFAIRGPRYILLYLIENN